jgi:hypothetical protein
MVTFNDGADDMPMKSLVLKLVPHQEGSGDPSPSNVRPISGYTSVTVYQNTSQSTTGATAYPINIPSSAGTVYGGELDVVNGTLKVTKASYILDTVAQYTWNGAMLYIDLNKAPLNKIDANNALCVCSHAQGVSNNYYYRNQSEDALASIGTARQIRFRNLSLEQTAVAYSAYFAQQIANGTPVTVVYEIATPIEITLDKTTTTTLLGSNTIWMSADGTIQAEYCADTKMYIDALTAPDDDMIANTNIANGKYFTVNNKLYISTSAIARGEQIIVGTNCNQTDLATALNALNA